MSSFGQSDYFHCIYQENNFKMIGRLYRVYTEDIIFSNYEEIMRSLSARLANSDK